MQFNSFLFEPNDYLIVAFSGGADSLACLHYLSKAHDVSKLSAFYLHHGLREEADTEVVFCRAICEKLGVSFYTDKVDIAKLAHEQKKSLEQVGREVRYAKLAELADKLKAKSNSQKLDSTHQLINSSTHQHASVSEHFKIVTAHHLDDQVESVLMQIFSGTSGLRIGIAEKIEINGVDVIRPLLQETKVNILNYCEENSLDYVTDGSNLENDFKRNKLRNIVIPMIRQTMNPNIEKAIERFKNISEEMSSYLDDQLAVLQKSLSLGMAYDLQLFLKLHPFIQKEFIKRELAGNGVAITTGLLEEIIAQLNSEKPNIKYLINNEFQLVKEYKVFKISGITSKEGVYCPLQFGENFVGDNLITVYVDTMCVVDKRRKSSICVDADMVDIDSLVIRSKEVGDAFVPLGMTGNKKLKDYFIDKKVPTSERDEVLVIEHIGGIIWVVGHEIDDRVKVTQNTQSFLVIEYTLPSG
jgi:tRNA(Ile)-lysidine synthase